MNFRAAGRRHASRRRRRGCRHLVGTAQFAVVAIGAGLLVIVSADGTPIWQVIRAAVVVLVAGLAWRVVARATGAARSARVAPALGVLLIASFAVPVGVGIGGPHVAKTGLRPLGVAGLVVGLGGVALFVCGVVALWRTTRRRTAVPISAAAVVVLALLVWSLGQATAATNVPRTDVGSATPDDVGLVYRDIEFAARDGTRLSGWYVPSRNGAAAVLLHGAGSTRSSVLDHAAVLARHGYGVLLYDARGHGRSAGRAMDFGWYGDEDIAGAVAFLRQQADIDERRVAAVGMSMGGEQAIGAAASVTGIRAVVAEGATNRTAADKEWLSDEFGLRGALSEWLGRLTYAFVDLLTEARPPISLHDAVADAAPRPVLLIAAGDVPDEARAGRFIQRAAPDTVEVWIVPGSGHTDGLKTRADEWEARVVAFLDRSLSA